MRFPNLVPQSEIDLHLRRSKPRHASAPPLPWGCALFGLSLLVLMRALL